MVAGNEKRQVADREGPDNLVTDADGLCCRCIFGHGRKICRNPCKMGHDKDQDGRKDGRRYKIRSVSPIILPTLPVSFVLAMEPAMEKKIRGTIRQKRRLRKICPIGLRKETLSPKTRPNIAPITHPVIRMIDPGNC